MPALHLIAGWVLTAAALAGAVYGLLSARALKTALRKTAPDPEAFPPATLLKPLYGAEPGLADHLAGFCRQDYPAPVQIVFGVQAATDPAIAVVESLKAKFPAADIALVVGAPPEGANPKIANLAGMTPHARHHLRQVGEAQARRQPIGPQGVVFGARRLAVVDAPLA